MPEVNGGDTTGIIKRFPFHSNRKRSSCLVRLSNGKYRLYVKGAPEMVLRLCDRLQYSVDGFKELTGDFQEVEGKVTGEGSRRRIVENCIYPMARQALRVIAFAYRDFETAQDWDEMVTYRTEEQKGVGDCPAVESQLTLWDCWVARILYVLRCLIRCWTVRRLVSLCEW